MQISLYSISKDLCSIKRALSSIQRGVDVNEYHERPCILSNEPYVLSSKPTATHCNTLQHTAAHSNTLQLIATHCNRGSWAHIKQVFWDLHTLQHIVTHCNTLQHTCISLQQGSVDP